MKQTELYDAAWEYLKVNHSHSDNDNDFQNAMNIAVMKAFVAGALWQKMRVKNQEFEFNDIKRIKNE